MATRIAFCVMLGMFAAGPAVAQNSIFDWFGFGEEESADAPDPSSPPEVDRAMPTEPLDQHSGDALGLVGAWTITTDRRDPECSLNGTAQISMTDTGGYTCELVMRDYCAGAWDGIIRQSCQISGTTDMISVDSTVLEALHGPLAGYSPDNFDLSLQEDGSLQGTLRSYGRYAAIWRRVYDGIS